MPKPALFALVAWSAAIAGALIDWGFKHLAVAYLPSWGEVVLLPYLLDMHLAYNRGAAFGLFSNWSGSSIALSAVSALACAMFAVWIWKSAHENQSRWWLCALALLLSGALGNLRDRLTQGYVVDYIHLHIGDYSLFVFNLADALLSAGVVLLLWLQWGRKRYN